MPANSETEKIRENRIKKSVLVGHFQGKAQPLKFSLRETNFAEIPVQIQPIAHVLRAVPLNSPLTKSALDTSGLV